LSVNDAKTNYPQNGPPKQEFPSDTASSTSTAGEVDEIIRLNISGGYFEVGTRYLTLNLT
jgi:hypothetical protein